nr:MULTISPECIES: secretion protein HlyD [Selenomonas]
MGVDFCPIEAANRTHSKGHVEDLLTTSRRKRCVKMAVPNLSVLP